MSDDLPIVDAHHHLWQLSGGPLYYPWLQDEKPHEFFLGDYAALKRDYLPADYRRDAAGHAVVKTVHVEAECSREQQVEETRWLSELHRAHGMPNAIVAHAWFHTPNAEEVLARQREFPLVRGIRSKPIGSMQDPTWLAGLRLLRKFGFSWDLRVPTWDLEEAAAVVRAHPDLPVVLNHTGFPWDRSAEGLEMWRRGMKASGGMRAGLLQALVPVPAPGRLGLRGQPARGARDDRPLRRRALHVRLQFSGRRPARVLRAHVRRLQAHDRGVFSERAPAPVS